MKAPDVRQILASDLDGAGVKDWHNRLVAARRRSELAYEAEWATIKREYAEKMGRRDV